MPTTCCAPGRTQRHSKSSDVRFFRLPKDAGRQKKWIISMKRMQADNSNRLCKFHDIICSLHFISGKYNLILH
uniref:THAP-type domain-containing protein n=1 Tax=Fundulus heteroclitus TaxID=8078 RepID=A0A3Q2P227_FUNHE